ncbi:MAG: hypothetical protein M3Z17_07980 [Gemmatimonadota bacterium]|nr:hypothetical protein [Gemmatimonadota bacterium]
MKAANSERVSKLNGAAGLIVACLAAACAPPPRRPPAPAPVTIPAPLLVADLPSIPVQSLVNDSGAVAKRDKGGRITLTSSNADLRDLLPLLASAAGVNLVMGPEVRGNVSVRFQNVRAIDALNAVIEQSGLVVGNPALEAPWPRPVYYDLPVNINLASAATMRARFNITQSLAEWIVKGRTF